jgi:hypothetical protein
MIFDGEKLKITVLDKLCVNIECIYSRWKEWVLKDDNAKYLQAFYVIDSDTPIYILINGWTIRGINQKNIKGRFL